ncbi:hypothetical protein L950_0222905 [Sphingobacterium sp. IITKGP-BTPF85]|nr:hypothetical protein L950_0222905 [Sphingobacterium sp. IITKGP-BTPF85]
MPQRFPFLYFLQHFLKQAHEKGENGLDAFVSAQKSIFSFENVS